MSNSKKKFKFLTVCEGGNVRSVSLAFLLRYSFLQDALACSHALTPQKTFNMLGEWADYIIVMQPHFASRIAQKHLKKLRHLDVGEDKWMNPLHRDLLDKLNAVVQGWEKRGFKI